MQSKPFFLTFYHKSPTRFLLICTTILSFLFFLWGINSWRFSFVGDEWQFYMYAKLLANSSHYPNPFSFSGVYHTHSQLASIYQSFFLTLFGPSNFAWRLSNIILIFPISYFFYKFVRDSFNKEIAIVSTIILQSSFYLANFFKIGYDNPQSFALFIVCLYLLRRFVENPTKRLALKTGLAFGISFYIYMGPIFPLFLWPYFLPLRKLFHLKKIQTSLILFAASYLVILLPVFTDFNSLQPVIGAFGASQNFHFNSLIIKDFLLFYKNNDYFYNHFVTGPYLDVISGIFCFIGTFIVLCKFKQKPYLFLLLSYATTTVIIAATSPEGFSPITRGIFLLPYGFIFAGVGLTSFISIFNNKSFVFICLWYVIFAIVIVNVYQSQIGVFINNRINVSGYTGMSLVIRSFQIAKAERRNVIILLSSTQGINMKLWELPSIMSAYGLETVNYKIFRPEQFYCLEQNTDVLYFQQDIQANQEIARLHCRQTATVQYFLLAPYITFF